MMNAVDRSGEVQQMLDTINDLQGEVAGSLQAFGKRIRILPDKDQKNQLNRLELDIPPGWQLVTRNQKQRVFICGVNYEEQKRQRQESLNKLDTICSPNIKDDKKLSNFLNQHVIIPFKSQHWPGYSMQKNITAELCGCSPKERLTILNQLEAIMGFSILMPEVNSREDNTMPVCEKLVWNIMERVKKDDLSCRVVTIDGNNNHIRTSDLLSEINKQFSEVGYIPIVLIISSHDNGVPDLEEDKLINRFWYNHLEESKNITKTLQLQGDLVARLNQAAINEPDKGAEIAQSVAAHRAANGWHIMTGPLDGYRQITSIEFDVNNQALDSIEPMQIPDDKKLQDFMNDNVITPLKNHRAYRNCGVLKVIRASVLCGPTIDERKKLLDNLLSTIKRNYYIFPPEGDDDDTVSAQSQVHDWYKLLISAVKADNVDCIVLVVDADRLKPQINVSELLKEIESKFSSAELSAIALIMSSGDARLEELPSDLKRFEFASMAKTSTKDRIKWHLLNEITRCCRDHLKECKGIDWTDAIEKVIDDMPKNLVFGLDVAKKEIKSACIDKSKEFFADLMDYCASRGLSQITQNAVAGVCKKSSSKYCKKLDKRVEDFIIPGQSALTEFLRSHVIKRLCKPDFFARYDQHFPCSFVLSGPPGTGKTHALKQLAEFTQLEFFEMNPNTVGSMYVDLCEKKMAIMFDIAKQSKGAIIMIDEIDSMLPNRDGLQQFNVKRINELLRHIEAAQSNQILVVGTTNRLRALDPAAIRAGRMEKIFEVKGLTCDDATELLKSRLEGFCQKDAPLDFAQAVKAMGQNRLVADVYSFCNGLLTFAAEQETYPLSQEILDSYLQSIAGQHRHSSGATLNATPSECYSHAAPDKGLKRLPSNQIEP